MKCKTDKIWINSKLAEVLMQLANCTRLEYEANSIENKVKVRTTTNFQPVRFYVNSKIVIVQTLKLKKIIKRSGFAVFKSTKLISRKI